MRTSVVSLVALSLLILTSTCVLGQEGDLDSVLRFEAGGDDLHGWLGGPPGTLHLDTSTVNSGRGAARLERDADSESEFSAITQVIHVDFDGDSLELSGFLRTEDVTGFAGLWMRVDRPGGVLQFDNMENRGLRGTTDWTEYTIRLPLDENANQIHFGVLVAGNGTVWADDLEFLVDGRPVAEAPERVPRQTILDTDREFESGSGITLTSLTDRQIEDVAILGTVWGFLKYHHPRIADGELHWDFELFRILPAILESADRDARNETITRWVDDLGMPAGCDPCAALPENAHLLPDLEWLEDEDVLGATLSHRLKDIHTRRFAGDEQFYVSQHHGVGNPLFDRELGYPDLEPPDAGYRILSVLRLWNIIEYWFPYRDQLDDDWHAVLREFLPRIVEANHWDAYRLELLALITRIQDTHANLWAALDARPPHGNCAWPVALRFVEDQLTVTAYTDEEQGMTSGLEIGDVIETIDEQPVDSFIVEWAPYYSASNETTRLRDIAGSIPRGECGETVLAIDRGGERQTVAVGRVNVERKRETHDRPGETFQLLSPDVAYVKLSSISSGDIGSYVDQAAGTRGLVIDIRNYPADFVVFTLGGRLVDENTPFARFTVGDLSSPGAFTWTPPLEITPQAPGYDGIVAVLVDEVSISNAEYTAMALRAGPRAVVVGSTTAGADGNVSQIPLPGGLSTMISGIGVFYPDKTPTQRIGIVPDIVAKPTVVGIRQGRDEVLEAALHHILGPEADEEMIRRAAMRP